MDYKYLNVGCGERPRKDVGWLNYDTRKFPHVDVVGDARKLPFEDNTFEIVQADQVIEHFAKAEIEPLFTEWLRVAKIGGLLRISTVEMNKLMDLWRVTDLVNLWDGIYGGQDYPEGFHKSGFTKESLIKLFEAHNLKIVEARGWVHRQIPRMLIAGEKTI